MKVTVLELVLDSYGKEHVQDTFVAKQLGYSGETSQYKITGAHDLLIATFWPCQTSSEFVLEHLQSHDGAQLTDFLSLRVGTSGNRTTRTGCKANSSRDIHIIISHLPTNSA